MNDVVLVSKDLPSHASKGEVLGNEFIKAEHLQTPRVKQLQVMSHEVDENHSEFLEGAKPGDFFNTITRENYGKEMYIINIKFTEEFVIWRKRERGGGLIGSFPSNAEALEHLKSQDLKVEDHEITQTQSHLLLKKDPETGALDSQPFIFDCSSSKLRVSREWNTQLQLVGGDRFSSLWKMSSSETQNRNGQKFWNIGVQNIGWVTDENYEAAKSLYTSVSK